VCRIVTKISSYWVDRTSRPGIKQLGVSFGSIFHLFSIESSQGHVHISWGKCPALALSDSPAVSILTERYNTIQKLIKEGLEERMDRG